MLQLKVSFINILKKTPYVSLNRCLSSLPNHILEPLTNRTLIRVAGPDVSTYLQGLITNDIEHLSSSPGSMYTAFLNTAGRMLYDAIVYRNLENSTFLIECDDKISEQLQKYLKVYRVRRKIDIANVGDELKLYTLFNVPQSGLDSDNVHVSDDRPTAPFKAHKDLLIYRDPRIGDLGHRIIAKTDIDVKTALGDIVSIGGPSDRNYRWLRYSLGVGEGVEDLPPGECFPLECNCDYLHGVSFQKGCYIGQELTARVHHTGVVRKRLMPIFFSKVPSKFPDVKITQNKVSLGKLRGIEKNVGLASLRIANALAFTEITVGDGVCTTSRPRWWPVEAPKEKANISKQ